MISLGPSEHFPTYAYLHIWVCAGPAIYDTIRDITHAQYRFGHVMICNEHFKTFFNRFVIVNGFKNSKNNDFRLFTVRDMHNTVWDMNDPNCIVLGPIDPLEYLVPQVVSVSCTGRCYQYLIGRES